MSVDMLRAVRKAGWILGAFVVLLLVVPSPLPGVGGSPQIATVPREPVASLHPDLVPSALGAPWAGRVGYDPVQNAAVTGTVAASGTVTVVITLRPQDPSFYTPPPFGSDPLTPAQIADRYAVSASQYQALEQYLTGRGLSILHEWPDRMSLTVNGPASLVGSAFGTALWSGSWQGKLVRFASSVPQLPAPYASEVAAVSGLSDGFNSFTIPFSGMQPTAVPAQGRTTRFITPTALHVAYQLNGLYNASGTSHWATGVGIALILWGEGYSPSDLQTFFGSYYPAEFPAIRLASYPVDGAPDPSAGAVNDPSGSAQELTLDLEWSGSEAPGATLDAVYAPDGPSSNGYSPSDAAMEDAVNKAIQSISGVQVVSMSFGTQDGSDVSFQVALSSAFATAAQRGVTVLAASGDNSGVSHVNCGGSADPQFPASSPAVVAVGGTAPSLSLDAFGAVTGIDSEPAWNGSGGGYSNQYRAPSWQLVGSAQVPIQASGFRGIPDVAGPAADNSFFFNGASAAGKGTSFATPMWAGMIAEMDAVRGRPLGFVTPRLYAIGAGEENHTTAAGLVDITGGSTCLGPATTGWDTATGWGSPRAFLLYEDLVSTYVTEALTTSSGNVAPGGSFEASVHVANLTSASPISNVVVTFVLTSDGQVGLCAGTLQTETAATDVGGNAAVGMGVPNCYFGSKVVVTATITSRGYFASNSTTLNVNLIGLAGFLAVIQVFPYNIIAFGLIILTSVVLAWRIGEWQHRRREARKRRVAPAPPGAGPTVAATAGPPPPAPPPPPPTAPDVASSGTATTGASPSTGGIPAHVLSPSAGASAAAVTSAEKLPRCPACGAATAFGDTVCPRCGATIP